MDFFSERSGRDFLKRSSLMERSYLEFYDSGIGLSITLCFHFVSDFQSPDLRKFTKVRNTTFCLKSQIAENLSELPKFWFRFWIQRKKLRLPTNFQHRSYFISQAWQCTISKNLTFEKNRFKVLKNSNSYWNSEEYQNPNWPFSA